VYPCIAEILGDSAPMTELKRYVPLVARSEAPVLITGETGTGKDRIAQAVHRLSPRSGAPFVPANCAALPETLIESELFGHERGSFTGAVTARQGKAAEADAGSLFLDEIGEMHPYGQAKLLRFLETGVIDRIGSPRPVRVDVRIIAATNLELEDLVRERRFRPDLYYRHRRELHRLARALGRVDATIRLFDPSYELGAIPARKRGSRQQWFGPGECRRLVLEVLRDALEPLSGRALARAVLARKGLEDSRDVLAVVQKTALAVLRRLVAKGVVHRQALADGMQVWERG
jgi:hypothetical protein